MKETVFIVIISLIWLLFLTFVKDTFLANRIDKKTIAICQEMAKKNQKDYENTEFKHMDFYQSCIDNIKYTSPLFRK